MLGGIHPNLAGELLAELDTHGHGHGHGHRVGHGVAGAAPRVARTDELRPDGNPMLRSDAVNDRHSTGAAR